MAVISSNWMSSLRPLERALADEVAGREHEWADRVGAGLGVLIQELRRHVAEGEAFDRTLAEMDGICPTLARQAAGLQREHAILLEQAIELRRQVQDARRTFEPLDPRARQAVSSPSAIPDFGALRQRAGRLLTDFRRHRERETDLVQESVTTDIGVGD